MHRNHTIAVVVPAFQEEKLIGETLKSIPSYVDRVFVIDDASTDLTRARALEIAEKDPRIQVISHPVNRGVGAAIVTGYKEVIKEKIDVVAVMAGDNQMDPEFLPALLDPVTEKKCDYVLGNRLISQEFRKGMSKWRFFGNAILTLLTKIASGYWQIMDPQNGYTAISRRALERLNLDEIYPRYGYCNDLLVRLNVWGFRALNVPHPARYGTERSGIRYSTYTFRVSGLLLRDFIWRMETKYVLFSFHPLVFFYLFGVILFLISIGLGIYSLYFKFIQGYPIFVPAVTTIIVFGLASQFILFAMLFDMEQEKSGEWYIE